MRPLTFHTIIAFAIILIMTGCSAKKLHTASTYDISNCNELSKKRITKKQRQPKVKHYASFQRPPQSAPSQDQVHVTKESLNLAFSEYDQDAQSFFQDSSVSRNESSGINDPVGLSSKVVASTTAQSLLNSSIQPKYADQEIPENINTITSWEIAGYMGASLLSSAFLLSFFTPQFMRVSAWAARHPKTSKALIAGIYTSTGIGAFALGQALFHEGQILPWQVMTSAALATIAGAVCYPRGTATLDLLTRNYLQRKYCDILLFTAGTAVIVSAGNLQQNFSTRPTIGVESSIVQKSSGVTSEIKPLKSPTPEGKHQEPKKKKNTGKKILAVFVFAVFTLALTAVSCSLACSGYGVPAILLLAGGETLAIVLLNNTLRKLNGTHKSQKKPSTEEPKPSASI